MIPGKVCAQIPQIVNDQVAGKLSILPQSISLTQILETAFNLFGLGNILQGGGGLGALGAAPKQVCRICIKNLSNIAFKAKNEFFCLNTICLHFFE